MPIGPVPPKPPRTPAEELRFLARTAYAQGRQQEATELYRKADAIETITRDRDR